MLKHVVFGCADLHLKFNHKKEKLDTYIVFDESKSVDYLDLNNKVIGYEVGKKEIKKSSKKSSKK